MADPTQQNRRAIRDGAQAVLPKGSPLAQSLAASKVAEDKQIALDEANNLVTQRQNPQLPPEAVAFTSAQPLTAPQAQQTAQVDQFVDPNQPATTQRAPAQGEAMSPGVPAVAAPTIPDQSGEINQTIQKYEGEANKVQSDIDALNAQRQKDIDEKIAADEKAVTTIQPTELFAGKSTWQKILGGVGMFLGSITPEGARNVANMIDKEIERDQALQLNNIKLKQDKGDKHFQMLMQKYGSTENALLAKKKDAYTALGLHVKKLEMTAKNAETRARLAQGAQEIELKKQALNVELQKAMFKQSEKDQQGSIPGYAGTIKDPVAAREFRTMVAEAPVVRQEINNLLKINDQFLGGSLSPSARAEAAKSQSLLVGKLRVAIAGPGTMSEGDRTLIESVIANPTDFFSLGSSNKIKLKGILDAYNRSLEANAKAYGLQKQLPSGAVKVNDPG